MLANDGDLKDQIKPFSQLTSYWKTAPVKQLFQAVWLQLLQVGSLAAVGLKNVLVKHASRPPLHLVVLGCFHMRWLYQSKTPVAASGPAHAYTQWLHPLLASLNV